MPTQQERIHCPYRGVDLTLYQYNRCTQGQCSVRNPDCFLLITRAQSSAKGTELVDAETGLSVHHERIPTTSAWDVPDNSP